MNRKLFLLMVIAGSLALNGCNGSTSQTPLIGKSTAIPEDDLLNASVLNSFGRVSDPQVSPDGKKIVYGVSYISVAQNKSNRELFVMDIDGSHSRQITFTPENESNARWLDNDHILFLNQGKLWTMRADGAGRKQIKGTERALAGFSLSPAKDKILYISYVPAGTRPTDLDPSLDKATGRIIDDLMYRHWDGFVEEIPHTFVASFDGTSVSQEKDLLEGLPYELPTLPFGGMEELSWSPDGKSVAYSCRKLTGAAYAVSTNTDIYLRNLETDEEVNLSEGMMGYDTAPVFSPCGTYLVWNSMERDGYEADKSRLMLYSFKDGSIKDLTARFRYNVDQAAWMPDGKGLYFISLSEGVRHVFALDLTTGKIRQITNGLYDCGPVQVTPGPSGEEQLIGTYVSLSMPTEVVSINPVTGAYTQLSHENKHLLDALTLGRVEERWVTTTDHKKCLPGLSIRRISTPKKNIRSSCSVQEGLNLLSPKAGLTAGAIN